MLRAMIGRLWFAATAVVVAAGLITQVIVTWRLDSGYFDSDASRIANLFCFFTVQSNIIVLVTSALLAIRVTRLPSWFWVLRLDGVLCITVTFIVFHVALASLQDLEGVAKFADFLLHTASPIMCVAGWVLFGPRGRTSWRLVGLAVVFPVAWLVFALVRGPLVGGYYPYPFLDVGDRGYPRVLLNSLMVAALFLAMAAGAHLLDRALDNRLTAPVRAA